jgi:hypothetical protein
LAFVESDHELELTNGYHPRLPGFESAFQKIPGFCNWSGHSEMKGDSQPWFDYRKGCISTKNPDEETIRKMIQIAQALDAKVQGDDGELYDKSYFSTQQQSIRRVENKIRKPWWKLWLL